MTEERAPSTTVVIPVWDAYATGRLHEAIASVQAQDRPVRIIVVDNASTVDLPPMDGVGTVKCPRRVSLGAARNAGMEVVETPYVIFWDADDVMLPGAIGYLEDQLDQDSGLVAFGLAIVEEDSGRRHRWPREWLGTLVRRPRALALVNCVWSVFPTTGATVIRTAVARDAGGFADAESGEDWCLGVSLVFRGRVGWSERAGRLYLRRPESVWASHSSVRHQLAHARVVRHRMGLDRSVPEWLRKLMPAVAGAQACAVFAHVAVARMRRAGGAA